MRVIAKRRLREFWERHPNARTSLENWYARVRRDDWDTPARVTEHYPRASLIGGDRVVFNVKGNTYRLIVAVDYQHGIVFIRFIGTHAEYDRIQAEEV